MQLIKLINNDQFIQRNKIDMKDIKLLYIIFLVKILDLIKKYIQRDNKKDKRHIAGQVIDITLNRSLTKFDIKNYVTVSKKLRSNVELKKEKNILEYHLIGICIRMKKDGYGINSSCLIRNVLSNYPFEYNLPLNSPFILYIVISSTRKKLRYIRHGRYYYLRKKQRPYSKVTWEYVAKMYDPDDLPISMGEQMDEIFPYRKIDIINRAIKLI